MHALQPIHLPASKSTIPSSRMNKAVTGQMGTQGASEQWLHRMTLKARCVLGKPPFSMYLTQVRLTPIGVSCSALQATVQAWQPIHFRLSMMNA